jgi:hypothetical protein
MIIGTMQDLLHVEENFECFKTKSTLKVLGELGPGFSIVGKTLNELSLIKVVL